MTSTLIDDIDARLKAGVRSILKKRTVAAGIDAGTRHTQVALVGTHGGRPVVHRLVNEEGAPSGRTASLVNERADIRACGLNGHDVRTFIFEFPPMPAAELGLLLRRNISQNLKAEPEIAFETAPSRDGEVEVMAVASSPERLSSAFSAMADSGAAADAAYADVTALAECVRAAYPDVETDATCVFNMGATWSELVLLDRGRLVFSRSIKMGLSNLIETTADLCGIPVEEAQELIFSAGAAVTFQDADEDDLMGRTYAESVREVIEQLVVEVHRSLSFATVRHGLPSPDIILLCGGASLVPGMAMVLGKDTGTRVEVFDPLDYMHKGDDVDSAANGSLFCVAIGLALLALRPSSPAFLPPGRTVRSGVERRVVMGLVLASIALFAVFITGRVLSSSAARYANAAETESLVLESLAGSLAESAGEAEPGSQTRAYAYTLLNEASPVWEDVLREISSVVPEGIVLTQMSFNRTALSPGERSEWTFAASGVVVDTDNTVLLLRQIEDALEASGLFRDVEVLPQGSTAFTYKGDRLTGAIRFELGARLE
ncbi:MAG: pilus assembly protein PilM [bacterium]|jgi:hypothetical protein